MAALPLMLDVRLELPWPGPLLSPNGRAHWGRVAKAKHRYREQCGKILVAPDVAVQVQKAGQLALGIVFHPPTKRSYDRDNLLARMKSGLDGMSDALGINDRVFVGGWELVGSKITGGLVRVRIVPWDWMQRALGIA